MGLGVVVVLPLVLWHHSHVVHHFPGFVVVAVAGHFRTGLQAPVVQVQCWCLPAAVVVFRAVLLLV